jgi:pimeloyl-ACP methyl ester carboxylesterase
MAADIKEFINEYALQNAVIIGHSMGGKTAMYFACKLPELLEKLIIVDISPKKYPVHHQEIIDALFSLNLSKIKNRNEADEELSIKIKDFSVRQFLLKNLYRQTSETFAWRFNLPVLAKNIEIIGEALYSDAEFLKPTLFIGGSNSNYILSDDENLIFRHFPKAQISIVKDAGHWIHAEAPEVFVEICFKFLF